MIWGELPQISDQDFDELQKVVDIKNIIDNIVKDDNYQKNRYKQLTKDSTMKETIQIKIFIGQIIINKLGKILNIINNQLLNNNKFMGQILQITIDRNIIHQI